jgi:NifB/MoaA-like Fe-S oxidoreductase
MITKTKLIKYNNKINYEKNEEIDEIKYINNKIEQQFDKVILNELSDEKLLEKYLKCKSVKK